jgi:GTP-binding protein YchF
VAGASKGEGLGNQFLANIRQCAVIVHVVRSFASGDIVHVSDKIDPKGDIEVIDTELILADIQTLENHLPKVQKMVKADPKAKEKLGYLTFLQNELMAGRTIASLPPHDLQAEYLDGLQLLTAKPVIYAFNVDESVLTDPAAQADLRQIIPSTAPAVFINAQIEAELSSLSPDEKHEFLTEYGIQTSGLEQLVKVAYDTLGLQSFLTAGPKEVRAWTIPQGATAPEAAGVIHTDFQKGFIAAQVVDYGDLVAAGSEPAARAKGQIRTEGKTYVMQPGDVVEFRFNV